MAHHGLAITASGEVIGFHAGQFVAFDSNGRVARVVRSELTEGHGITVVREEFLWITDPGFVFAPTSDEGDETWAPMFGKGVRTAFREHRVAKLTLDGQIRAELPTPSIDPVFAPRIMGRYCPCGSAVDEEPFGGSGEIWVADGYGSSLVHQFDKHGTHGFTLSGEEGGGRFSCPHAVFVRHRPARRPELYIADGENKRVQVYDLEGRYLRTFGDTFLNSPSAFAQWGDVLVIAELYSRLAVVDSEDQFLGYIGADPSAPTDGGWPTRPGWPNSLDGGRTCDCAGTRLGSFQLAPLVSG